MIIILIQPKDALMSKKGFTLVELAIVIVIIGVLTVGVVKLMNNSVNSSRHTSSQNAIETALKQLAEYSARAQHIPAAAELGLAVTNTRDAFGTELYYFPDSILVNPTVSGGVSSICSVQSTGITVNICADASCNSVTSTVSNVAFFLASAGSNENLQFTQDGSDFSVYPHETIVDGYSIDVTDSEEYDDFTGWMTLDTLKTYAGCTGFGLDINQNQLPAITHGNRYNYTLTPRGGVAPYRWCVESDDTNVRTLNYSSSSSQSIKSIGGCDDSGYVSGNSVELVSSTNLSIASDSPSDALIRVRLIDNRGITLNKQYVVSVLHGYELAMAAKDNSSDDEESDSGIGDFVSSNSHDNNSNTAANKHSFLVSDESLTIVMNSGSSTDSAMIACSANPTSADSCPAFGNHGILRAYFTLEKYDTTADNTYYLSWTYPLGFVFTAIKSYKPGTSYVSTLGMTGDPDSGLGYGGSGGDPLGMRAGHSFGVEFDTYQDGGKNDKDGDHLAVVGYANNTIYTNPRTYKAYSDNIHSSTRSGCTTNSSGWVVQYNDPPDDSCGGKGFYYNSSAEVIPNSYPTLKRIGFRMEAISGCNSTGTECNAKSGTSNYVCVFGWRQLESDMDANPTLKTNMQKISVSHAYNALSGTANPLGEPIMKDCFPNDTASEDYLDYIRYGFTSSAWFNYSVGGGNTAYMPHYFKITDFAIKVTQY